MELFVIIVNDLKLPTIITNCYIFDVVAVLDVPLVHSAKSNNGKKCMVCHYWFFNHRFKYQDNVCNGCHNSLMQCVNISNIAITAVKGVDYRCIIHDITKSEAINLLENSMLGDCGYI